MSCRCNSVCRRISVDTVKCAARLSLPLPLSFARKRPACPHCAEYERRTNRSAIAIAVLDAGPRCCENGGRWSWRRGTGCADGGEPGARKGARLPEGGVSSNRRVSAACFNLTSLSASVPSAVARTLLASRLSSRTRQSPGFNIKPPRSLVPAGARALSASLSPSPSPGDYSLRPVRVPPCEELDGGFSARASRWRRAIVGHRCAAISCA